MIEVRIDAKAPSAGQCYFCWQHVQVRQPVPVVYEHGRLYKGAVCCDRCASVDGRTLRGEMFELAARAEAISEDAEAMELVAELREAATGAIRRPLADVLELERLYHLDEACARP